ncbi:MAG: hypothetical protein Q7W30_05115 [Coriobacteriia bacterium]|nr:hypothetical protein [Coriobacteriia bacterium]
MASIENLGADDTAASPHEAEGAAQRREDSATPSRRATVSSRVLGALLFVAAGVSYLASRVYLLDIDQPRWHVAHYSSIDEYSYLMPAINLFRHGTWTFRSAPYTPLYGWPMNMLDNVVGWGTLSVWGPNYYGLRMGAVLMGLGMFFATLLTVRALARDARGEGASGGRGPLLITAAVAVFMLVEFSTLVASRVAEPTMGRTLAVAILLCLTANRVFLPEDRSKFLPTLALGIYAGASVWFVYIYNAYIIPAVGIALLAWVWRDGLKAILRHGATLAAGILISTGAYFGLIKLMYGLGVPEWYRTWIGAYSGSNRVAGISLKSLWYVLQSTLFRLNQPLLLLFLLALGVFLWWTMTTRRPLGVLIVATMLMFEVQSVFLSDYWGRKFVTVAPVVFIVIAVAFIRFRPFTDWLRSRRRHLIIGGAWLAIVVTLFLGATAIAGTPADWYLTPAKSLAFSRVGLVALVIGLALAYVPSRPWTGLVAGGLVIAALILPSVWADRQYVYGFPTTAYRDTLIRLGSVIDGRVTAGHAAWSMQFYNTSDPQLCGYYYGVSKSEYERALVRYFKEGRASALFTYSDEVSRASLQSLGFSLVETYDMNLPRRKMMGRYEYVGGP